MAVEYDRQTSGTGQNECGSGGPIGPYRDEGQAGPFRAPTEDLGVDDLREEHTIENLDEPAGMADGANENEVAVTVTLEVDERWILVAATVRREPNALKSEAEVSSRSLQVEHRAASVRRWRQVSFDPRQVGRKALDLQEVEERH